MSEENAVELYRRHRPCNIKEIVGQVEAVKSLGSMWKGDGIPHFLLFTGPSGVGKTTLARILVSKLKCTGSNFIEVNAASQRGIDMVRRIEERWGMRPMGGGCRVWLCDEAHKLTSDAQGAFLKLLEDTPDWVYFMFCTTDPHKLRVTIKTRATIVDLKSIGLSDLKKLINRVAHEEGKVLGEDVSDKIADLAEGSARKALVMLAQVINVPVNDQLDVLSRTEPKKDAIEVARALMGRKGWSEVAKILSGIEALEENAEGIRRLVLSYMTSVALKGGKNTSHACFVIDCFSDPFYDTGRAGLVASCHAVVGGKKYG